MNEQFHEKMEFFLDFCFKEEIREIRFRGRAGPIEIVKYDGVTKAGEIFWGQFRLADEFALIDWIEIHLQGQFYKFSYEPELEEPFVRH